MNKVDIKSFNLNKTIIKIFEAKGFKKLTPIQEKTIPLLLKNKNLIGVSATGTGKTLAYLIPSLNNIDLNKKTQIIIIAPTRELARQIYSECQFFSKYMKELKSLLIIGGADIEQQINNINRKKPHLIIATPTRLKEIITKDIKPFEDLKTIILDEADMLMDLGFANYLDYIFDKITDEQTQKMAWSATLHELLVAKLSKYFTNTKIIKIGKSIYENNKVTHNIIHYFDKAKALEVFVKTKSPYLCIIFTNRKEEIAKIVKLLEQLNIKAIGIHGSLSSRERATNYKRIKNLEYQYVVASDLASRGLDIDGVSDIINWDLPDDPEWYVHRAGRCGRGIYEGNSYLFFDGEYEKKLLQLQAKGITFKHISITKNTFVKKDYKLGKKTISMDQKSKNEINKIYNSKNKKVKPGYKKKQKEQIKKIKQKSKRKYLEKKMNENRIEGYKKK